jgi:hypothetical protein
MFAADRETQTTDGSEGDHQHPKTMKKQQETKGRTQAHT